MANDKLLTVSEVAEAMRTRQETEKCWLNGKLALTVEEAAKLVGIGAQFHKRDEQNLKGRPG